MESRGETAPGRSDQCLAFNLLRFYSLDENNKPKADPTEIYLIEIQIKKER